MKKILTIAHRGASAYAPENTLTAFKKAMELGADFIELDVQATKDSEVVVFHDEAFKNGKTLSQMYVDGVREEGLIHGIDIPLLSEVIETLSARIGLNIEVKTEGAAPLLVPLLQTCSEHGIILSSLNEAVLRELKEAFPRIMLGGISDTELTDPLAFLGRVNADILIQHVDFLNPDHIELIHSEMKRLFVWTVNNPGEIRRMIHYGVDGIITDYPDRVVSYLS
ncbi:MAG: glycerophosphodiester phosphodiesterase [Candidatus Omnitrophica bacterium]|nr:glycerophosphodiester phosphodiesterase [Candidatus Omnitrophota bacterium]